MAVGKITRASVSRYAGRQNRLLYQEVPANKALIVCFAVHHSIYAQDLFNTSHGYYQSQYQL